MLMGMSKDEYYNGDNTLTKDYRKLYDLKKQEMNYQLWLQGFYVYQAVASLVPLLQPYSKSTKVIPYMDKPLPITQDEIKQAKKDEEREQAELQKLKFLQMVNNINSNMSKEGEQGGRQ